MHGYQFQKTDRLLKRQVFLHILQNGKQRRDRYFIVRFGLNGLEKPRLGITVTKKVGNAVVRNRLKRIAREFFRLNRQTLKSHFDIVIIAKNQAAELDSKQVFSSLMYLFNQLPKNAND